VTRISIRKGLLCGYEWQALRDRKTMADGAFFVR
jgi:hypothetical protein